MTALATFVFTILVGVFAGAQPFACYENAKRTTNLSEDAVRALCCKKSDLGPLECFQAAQTSPLSLSDSISLCSCSNSTAPVNCYNSARVNTYLSETEILSVCKAEGAKPPQTPQSSVPGWSLPQGSSAGGVTPLGVHPVQPGWLPNPEYWQNGVIPPPPAPPVVNR